jgi:hypothetical protein
LTPHAAAIDRALAAVAVVNDTIDKIGSTGELKAFNRAFKEARTSIPTSSFSTTSTPGKRRCSRPWRGRRDGDWMYINVHFYTRSALASFSVGKSDIGFWISVLRYDLLAASRELLERLL